MSVAEREPKHPLSDQVLDTVLDRVGIPIIDKLQLLREIGDWTFSLIA